MEYVKMILMSSWLILSLSTEFFVVSSIKICVGGIETR